MRLRIAAALALAAALGFAAPALAGAYDGDWAGSISAGGQTLHLVLHVKSDDKGTSAVLDSVDQGATIPATAVKTENGELSVLFLSIGGDYSAKLSADGKTLAGTWTQGGSIPLVMTKK